MSKRIEDIDVNFKAASLNGMDLVFANALERPFELSGFAWYSKERKLCRLPSNLTPVINDGVKNLVWHTAGGMIRFRSDSNLIAIRADIESMYEIPRMPRLTSGGFDLYIGTGREKRFVRPAPPSNGAMKVEALIDSGLPGGSLRDWTVYMPPYGRPGSMEIGVLPGFAVKAPTPFSIPKPIAFYGSSITQGACASRPGNCYTNILARWMDAPVVNLGFAGSARGDKAIAEAIASLELSAFVLDYAHNAPNPKHLEETHEPFFRIVREKQPELPIVIVSKCDFFPNEDCIKRREIIKATWRRAIERGDRNTYFVDGETLFGTADRDACTVDGCHPNDLGFYRMAENIIPTLRKALHS
jgi:hypothetical protein